MSYEEKPRSVRLEGDDLDRARGHSSTSGNELRELAMIVSRTLGRGDEANLVQGFSVTVTVGSKVADEAVDVTLATYCSSDGECLGVYDAVAMECRACTESEAAHCLQSGG